MDVQPSKDESAAVIEASTEDDVLSSSESGSEEESVSRSRQSPSRKNASDHHRFPYVTVLPRHERRRIKLEVRRNKKLGKLKLLASVVC